LRDHITSAKLARVAEMLGSSQDKKSAALLRAILDKHPNKEVKAEAFMALARPMQARVALGKQLKDNPQAAKSVEESYGKDYALELQQADPAKLGAEAETLYAELTEKYLPDLKPASIAILCQQLYYTNDSEMLLRALYTSDKRDQVRRLGRAEGTAHRGLEGAVAITQQNTRIPGEVEMAVSIKVSYDPSPMNASVAHTGLEGAVAIAQQVRHGRITDRGEVGNAVPIEIRYRQGAQMAAHGVPLGSLKRAVALAEQDPHAYVAAHREVGNAVPIEIRHGD
jgi:hypothetical protein